MARRASSEGVHRHTPVEVAQSFFGDPELEMLRDIQPLAEELVGEYFQLTSFGPIKRCYDVITLQEKASECVEPQALAKLCRYDRSERPIDGSQRVSRFYRIALQDDAILGRVTEGLKLRALLLYVLVHELIHIVRFESFQVFYDTTESTRMDEEITVHHLATQVLKSIWDQDIESVVEKLSPSRVDVVDLQS